MKKILSISLLSLFLISCGVTNPQNIRTENRSNLNKISLGMSKSDVLKIMGTETVNTSTYGPINNPYRSEIVSESGKNYEVIFYFTDLKKSDSMITDDELSPIVFFDGKVVGYGWLYLKDNIKRYQIDVR